MGEENVEDRLADAMIRAVDAAVPKLIATLRQTAPQLIATEQEMRRGFEERLAERWKQPFELYQMILASARELVVNFDTENRPDAVRDQDLVFEVVRKLAVRACRVASEVFCLLQGGFADGAHARWRTIHELATTASFVRRAGIDTAERYLLYEHIEAYKAAKQLQEHVGKLKEQPYSAAEMERFKTNRDRLVQRYGKEFAWEYGWAAEATKRFDPSFRGRITFEVLERSAGIGHLRPYYKMASNQVHAGPKGVAKTLGTIGNYRIDLMGPSNTGLADPGQGVLISLLQILAALLVHKPSFNLLLGVRALQTLADEGAKAFVEVQHQLRTEESEKIETESEAPDNAQSD